MVICDYELEYSYSKEGNPLYEVWCGNEKLKTFRHKIDALGYIDYMNNQQLGN